MCALLKSSVWYRVNSTLTSLTDEDTMYRTGPWGKIYPRLIQCSNTTQFLSVTLISVQLIIQSQGSYLSLLLHLSKTEVGRPMPSVVPSTSNI